MTDETPKEMVSRHVRQGENHVTRQREIVAELDAGGHKTELANTLLDEFEHTLAEHKAHLARLIDEEG
jgi:hypothetical protein